MRSQSLFVALYRIPVNMSMRVRAITLPVQAGFFRHAARQSSIGLPSVGAPVLVKPHSSSLLTLELKHEATALLQFPVGFMVRVTVRVRDMMIISVMATEMATLKLSPSLPHSL